VTVGCRRLPQDREAAGLSSSKSSPRRPPHLFHCSSRFPRRPVDPARAVWSQVFVRQNVASFPGPRPTGKGQLGRLAGSRPVLRSGPV